MIILPEYIVYGSHFFRLIILHVINQEIIFAVKFALKKRRSHLEMMNSIYCFCFEKTLQVLVEYFDVSNDMRNTHLMSIVLY